MGLIQGLVIHRSMRVLRDVVHTSVWLYRRHYGSYLSLDLPVLQGFGIEEVEDVDEGVQPPGLLQKLLPEAVDEFIPHEFPRVLFSEQVHLAQVGGGVRFPDGCFYRLANVFEKLAFVVVDPHHNVIRQEVIGGQVVGVTDEVSRASGKKLSVDGRHLQAERVGSA